MLDKLVYSWDNGMMAMGESLWKALALSGGFPMAIALVGAGGKTTTMYALAEELAQKGKRVLCTTTTHILIPAGRPLSIWAGDGKVGSPDPGWLEGLRPKPGGYRVAGMPGMDGKLVSLPKPALDCLKSYADVVLVEADGAKGMPFKVPRGHEPAIPDMADAVIACAGLDCLDAAPTPSGGGYVGPMGQGRPMGEVCFGWKEARRLWEPDNPFDGARWEDVSITPELAARILMDGKGGRKHAGGRRFRILLNKADNQERILNGCRMARAVDAMRAVGDGMACVMTSYLKQGG